MNDLILITVQNDKNDGQIQFHLNKEELTEFLAGKVFQALLDDLCKVSFER